LLRLLATGGHGTDLFLVLVVQQRDLEFPDVRARLDKSWPDLLQRMHARSGKPVVGRILAGVLLFDPKALLPRRQLLGPGDCSHLVLEPAILPADAAAAFFTQAAPVFAAYRSGDVAKAIDLFMSAVGAPDWRSAVASSVRGATEQAEKDAATSFDVEIPALQKGLFDGARASCIAQPVLYVLGGESGPIFEAAMQHFLSLMPHTESVVISETNHLMQLRDPKPIASVIGNFLSRNPF
jgi:pimeloyl-ACP methyl ester carboxylesterase